MGSTDRVERPGFGDAAAGRGDWMSGLTTIAKFDTSGSSSIVESALRSGTRMRCSIMPRVSSLGTSR